MARDASGNYTLPAGNPVAGGTTITTTWANPTLDDVATELTASLDRSGQGGMLAQLKAFSGIVTLPGISFSDEVTSGWYRAGAADIRFSVLTNDAVQFVDASGETSGEQSPLKIWDGAAFKKVLYAGGPSTGAYILKTANYTAVSGQNILADTGGGAFTITLPITPSLSDRVIIADNGQSWGTTPLVVGRNGQTIVGVAADLNLNIDDVSVELIFDGTTWQVYTQVGVANGNAVTTTATQTLTNKTLTAPTITGVVSGTSTAAGLTAGAANAIKSATTDVDTSAATAPTSGQVLTATGDSAATWQDAGTPAVIQVVSAADGVTATGTTAIPFDNTIPQITEGDQYLSVAITPLSATSTLIIDVVLQNEVAAGGGRMTVALFQDSTADALAAVVGPVGTNSYASTPLRHAIASGSTAARTFKVRAGHSVGSSTRINGFGGAQLYGGVSASTITIWEVEL